jgi:hypothetical protein
MTRSRVALACAAVAATLALAYAPAASATTTTTSCTYGVLARVLGNFEPSCTTGTLICPAYAVCTATGRVTVTSLLGLGPSGGGLTITDRSLFGGTAANQCTGTAKTCTTAVTLGRPPDFDGGLWNATCGSTGTGALGILTTVNCVLTVTATAP